MIGRLIIHEGIEQISEYIKDTGANLLTVRKRACKYGTGVGQNKFWSIVLELEVEVSV